MMLEILSKSIPWKKLAAWAIIVLIVDLSTLWLVQEGKAPVKLLYLIIAFSAVVVLVDLVTSYRLEKQKLENQLKPKVDLDFKKDVKAPNSEFGTIKGRHASGQTKSTFHGKVDAPGSKFGNIEQ